MELPTQLDSLSVLPQGFSIDQDGSDGNVTVLFELKSFCVEHMHLPLAGREPK